MNNKGFTLIELVACLIIISVLTAIAVPKFIDLRSNAEKRLMLAVLSEFNAQETLAYNENRFSSNPKDPYESPIKAGVLSSGMSLSGADPSYVLFTGGGKYDVYRWTYDDAPAVWHDTKQTSSGHNWGPGGNPNNPGHDPNGPGNSENSPGHNK